jgi:membrane protease YdiL (CAAX protease family)
MLLTSAALSTLPNLLVLAGLPFSAYFAYKKWRHKRSLGEITRRARIQLGAGRHVAYSVRFALSGVAALAIWPPALGPFHREGSPQQPFVGLGPSGPAVSMATLYGVVKTGFPEELLFRGLIAGSLSRRLPVLWANLGLSG